MVEKFSFLILLTLLVGPNDILYMVKLGFVGADLDPPVALFSVTNDQSPEFFR